MSEEKKVYKNRCPMPFGAIHYSMAGTVGICPFITTNKKTITIEEYRKEPVLLELKRQLLNDERPDMCHECYYLEDQGLGSERLDKVNHFEEDVYELDELHHIEVRFSNLCNSKCRICYDHVSSQCASENKMFDFPNDPTYKVMRTPGPYEAFVLDQTKSVANTLRRITFSGGEPMLHWQHWDLLNYFIDNGYKPKLNYYSNNSTLEFKGQHIFDKWKHFGEVDFRISVDARGKGHEYWRAGTKWQTILDNVKAIQNSGLPIKRTYITTLAWPILYSWKDMLEELYELDPTGIFNTTVVYSDEYLLHTLPIEEKHRAAEELRKIKVWDKIDPTRIDGIIKYMFSRDTSELMPAAVADIREKDRRRNESIFDAFPEWTDLMKQYGYEPNNPDLGTR